jgi:hypothetical protein
VVLVRLSVHDEGDRQLALAERLEQLPRAREELDAGHEPVLVVLLGGLVGERVAEVEQDGTHAHGDLLPAHVDVSSRERDREAGQ